MSWRLFAVLCAVGLEWAGCTATPVPNDKADAMDGFDISNMSPPPAPQKWICDNCNHVYDPAKDDPSKQNTPFEKLPSTWTCPVCGAPKSSYAPQLKPDGSTAWVHQYGHSNDNKGACTAYFGKDVDSNATTGTLWTVADVDVHMGFPFGNETFIHHSGPGSECHSPGPPAGCHRYYVASYEASKCTASCPLMNGNARGLAGNIDSTAAFDRAAGVLKGCFECLKHVEVSCWGAPADNPVKCKCPGL